MTSITNDQFSIIPNTEGKFEITFCAAIRRTDGLDVIFTKLNNEPAIEIIMYGMKKIIMVEYYIFISYKIF